MQFHTLRREQWTPRPINEIFAFFSDARNLAEITPPWLSFRILTPAPVPIQQGTELRYRLAVHGLPVRWLTRISRWRPPYSFTDIQISGPYSLWHHTHTFEPRDGGTLMRDTVRYRLPFGPLGRIVNKLFVSRDVRRIFDYRERRIRELFGEPVKQ